MTRRLWLVLPLGLLLFAALVPTHLAGTPDLVAGGSTTALTAANSSASSDPSSSSITCPVDTNITLGSVTLNCFQSLDLAEVGAILIGVAITVYIYWDSDRAELPGDSSEVPVTSAEEVELMEKRRKLK